jgi:flagellar basal-body rod protein FlgF
MHRSNAKLFVTKGLEMENPIFIGLSKQVVLQTQMDLVANNIANMNTPGYRAQNMVFEEHMSAPKGTDDPLSMVVDFGQYHVTRPGPVKITGNPFDLALNGPGYFGVQTQDGTKYTRAGNFEINALGELVTPTGYPVAGAGGGTIIIPVDAGPVKITPEGTISTAEGEIGKLMVVEFENPQMLNPTGDNLYETEETGTPSETTTVTQGALEGSNVQAVHEMTEMIRIMREFQMVQRSLQNEHDRQRTVIQRLTQQ